MDRKKSFLVTIGADIVAYFISSLLILYFHPSFDSFLGWRIIILQCVLAFAVIGLSRFIIGVYQRRKAASLQNVSIRLFISDGISLVLLFIAQFVLAHTDRIEFVTLTMICASTLLEGFAIRFLVAEISQRSINLTETIPFSPPDISELEIMEVEKALRSGWITTGPRTKKLEKMIKDYVGADGCVCLNSNTACAEMALRILGIGSGDEVITCAYTYTATASVVLHLGAKLVLVDCSSSKGSVEMDYDALEKAITDRTKAIIPIDLAGIPCDYQKIFEIVERRRGLFVPANDIQRALGRIAVVTDGAHALGAEYHGKMVGSVADFTNFSFHAVKNFTTGEGGAMTWKHIEGISDEEIYKKSQLFSLHGQSKDALAKTQKGGWEYDVVGPFYKCNMTDVAAAIGLAQFERYPHMLKRREAIIEKYDKALKPLGVETLVHFSDSYRSSGHLYLTRIPGISTEQRNAIIVEMAAKNVSCNVHYKPLPMLTAYRELGFDISDYPNAYSKFENEITLPLYSTLSDSEVDCIIRRYTEILKEYI